MAMDTWIIYFSQSFSFFNHFQVWYCSAGCKKANVSAHTAVCRAYITVRRFVEDKVAFARKLQEPEDGCATCGFWRESLEACSKCQKVRRREFGCRFLLFMLCLSGFLL